MLIDQNLPGVDSEESDTHLQIVMTFTLSSTPVGAADYAAKEFVQWLSSCTTDDYEATTGQVDSLRIIRR